MDMVKKAKRYKEKIQVLGKKIGKLTPYEKVMGRTPGGVSEIFYKCHCDCGNDFLVRKACLIKGLSTHCGCEKKKKYKYVGNRYGKLVVVERIRDNKHYYSYRYRCKCDCGKYIVLTLHQLLVTGRTSCGCEGLIGKAFGNWEVLCRDTVTDNQAENSPRYWCRCRKCGSVKTIPSQSLKLSALPICKLCKDKARKYPKTGSRIYHIWQGMKQRCKGGRGENGERYYAGRGIKYQPSWEKFKNFYDDMKDGYADNLQLDRIDPDGDYTKENCRWITAKENSRNRRDNTIVTAGGETHVQAWWIEKYGLSSSGSLPKRLQRDYGDDWEIAHGHRQNWLPTPRYHI